MTKRKINLILTTATLLMKPNNTVSTLEIKQKLRQDYPKDKWFQNDVSDVMDHAATTGVFTFVNNVSGRFRIYSLPKKKKAKAAVAPTTTKIVAKKPVVQRISKTKAFQLISDTNGKFFTVTCIKKDGSERIMNCRHRGQAKVSPLGYITVIDVAKQRKDPNDCLRRINLQTVKSLSTSGNMYKVN